MNTDLELIADRHFRPDPQGVLAPRGKPRVARVLVTTDARIASTSAGQLLTWMLVNLLGRQVGVVTEICVEVPDTPLLDGVAPFGAGDSLYSTVVECVRLVAGNHMRVTRATAPGQTCDNADVHLLVGSSDSRNRGKKTWFLYADGWRWYVGTSSAYPRSAPASPLAIGPYIAACFGAGEVFKLLRSMMPGKGEHIAELFGSAWSMTTAASWEQLEEGPALVGIPSIPHTYFAGAGAVAQAAALALGSSGLRGTATVVDHDRLDLTNDNRYVLSHLGNGGELKVDLMSRYLNERRIACHPVASRWEKYIRSSGRKAKTEDVAALERDFRYPLVLSCVDENDARHALQNLVPGLIIGGSTDGLTAKAATYHLGGTGSCLKCFNPIPQRNLAIQKQLAAARRMTAHEQWQLCSELGITAEDLDRALHSSGCGKLSEADLARFSKGPPQMSVGFVSMAAGALLSAQLVRILVLGAAAATSNGQIIVATFAKPGLRTIKTGPDTNCDCGSRLRGRWASLWNAESSQA